MDMDDGISLSEMENEPDIENQAGENSAESGNVTDEEQGESRHGVSNPRRMGFLLGIYLVFLCLVWTMVDHSTKSPVTSPFITVSIILFAIAFVEICILSWIHELPQSRQRVSIFWFRFFMNGYYIVCAAALICVVVPAVNPKL